MAQNPDLACGILTNIGELWLEEEFCDLTINIDDYQFRCHKFHLSANSAFFKTLLRSENTDGSTNSISHVTIRGIDPEIFGLVLKAVYKGENCVDENNMIQVWHAAHELQIDVLVSKCEDFVMAHMTLDNYENIYYSSVLLESTRVRKFAFDFMAKHFDKFKQSSLFLDLPSNFLIDIVNSEALVVGSHEGLVDSILMWGSYKYEQNDESDDNTVVVKANDLDIQTKGDKQCVEIMFSQPPADLEDESSRRKLRQILQETERREETLGKLLNLAKLEQTSPDYIKSLVDNDWLMGNKDTRHIVWTASVTQANPTASVVRGRSDHPTHADKFCEDVFVYRLKNSGGHVAHRWTTGKRYAVTSKIQRYSEYLSSTYSMPPTFTPRRSSDKLTLDEFRVGETELVPGNLMKDASHATLVDDYLYCFVENKVYRTSEFKDPLRRSWSCVGELPGADYVKSVAVHGHHIVLFLFCSCDEVRGKNVKKYSLKNYSLNTSDLTFKSLSKTHTWSSFTNYNPPAVLFFYHKEKLYILNEKGHLWSVDVSSDPGNGLTEVGKDGERLSLWSSSLTLHGAATWNNELVIFADLPADRKISAIYSEELGLQLKFVQALPSDSCYHVRVPESLLGKAV